MRQLSTSNITNTVGMPVKSGTLNFLQQAYQDCITAILNGELGQAYTANVPYIIYGCEVSGTTGNEISAWAIFYNGEVFLVDAVTLSAFPPIGVYLGASIVTTYFTDPTADPVTFTDASTHNVHEIRKIVFNYFSSGDPTNIFSGSSAIAPPTVYPQWKNITLSTSPVNWTNYGTVGVNNGFPASYRIEGNCVMLSGIITGACPAPGTFTLFNLPFTLAYDSGVIPAQVLIPGRVYTGSSLTALTLTDILLFINADGSVQINPAAGMTPIIYLDGISFRLS